MEYVTLVKKASMGITVKSVALQSAMTMSVIELRESVMSAKLGFMGMNAKQHVLDVSMANATRRVVSAKKTVKMVSMVVIVMKLAQCIVVTNVIK